MSADIPHADERGEAGAEQAASSDHSENRKQIDQRVVRWRGRRTGPKDITATPNDIRPADVIVIPTRHPGPWRALGDFEIDQDADPNPVLLDVGDRSHRIARAKPILRLHSILVSSWPDSLPAKATALTLLKNLEQRYEEDPDGFAEDLRNLLASLAATEAPTGWSWLTEAARELASEFPSVRSLRSECRMTGEASLVLAGRRRVPNLSGEADAFSDDDDASASGTAHRDGGPVTLKAHLLGVEAFAWRHAVGCGLPAPMVEAVACAGLLHDVGKADFRFQSLLRGGSPWRASELLAKSPHMPKTRAARRRARESAGYPEGGRHELQSVRLAESVPAILPRDEDLRDLVLHLVASHHGYCRPFGPVVTDEAAPHIAFELRGYRLRWSGPTGLERLDSGIAERYWRLTRRYGWWGLALLEALLRLADWRRSEWEEVHDAEG